MLSFKYFMEESENYKPSELDYQHVYKQRNAGKSARSILYGDRDIKPLGIRNHRMYTKIFDSEEAQRRPDYIPHGARWQKAAPTEQDYAKLYRMRKSGMPDYKIHETLGIHKDTVSKYYDSGEAQKRKDYVPRNVYWGNK